MIWLHPATENLCTYIYCVFPEKVPLLIIHLMNTKVTEITFTSSVARLSHANNVCVQDEMTIGHVCKLSYSC